MIRKRVHAFNVYDLIVLVYSCGLGYFGPLENVLAFLAFGFVVFLFV